MVTERYQKRSTFHKKTLLEFVFAHTRVYWKS